MICKKKVRVRVPGTCGELVQGKYFGRESLVSLPVDEYNEVTAYLCDKPVTLKLKNKSSRALLKTAKALGLKEEMTSRIKVEIINGLPIGKGMASSTADIYGVVAAVCELFDRKATHELVSKICTDIEATDSIMFENLTLYDHLNGSVIKSYDWMPKANILILESEQIIITDNMRSCDYETRLEMKSLEPFEVFDLGMEQRDVKKVFRAATLSAIENEIVFKKKFLHEIIDIAEKGSALGVCCAHSGSVLGIIYEDTDIDRIVESLRDEGILEYYSNIRKRKIINGGYELLTI
jgi:L-threonine kinase